MHPEEIKQMIEVGLTSAEAFVKGDGTHFEAIIVCPDFVGKSTIKRHQMVYGTLGNSFAVNTIHALSIKTYTPKEWEAVNQPQVS
jgi:acid stress-induced BolA-like protein IbaG/YrbA